MIKDNDDMEFKSDKCDCEDMSSLEDNNKDELSLLVEESLIIRCTLQVQIKEDKIIQQIETFFMHVFMYKIRCILIIDSRSYANICSIVFFSKLNLRIVKHVKPYKLQWLNDSGELRLQSRLWFYFLLRSMLMRFMLRRINVSKSYIIRETMTV